MEQESNPHCCEFLPRWAADDNSPICFDNQMSRYFVKTLNRTGYFIFCPFCGKKLITSKKRFTVPAEILSQVSVVQRTARNLEDVKSALGNPDECNGPADEPLFSQTFVYRTKWPEVVLYVTQEKTTGKINYCFAFGQS